MSRSQRVPLSDVARAMRLIGELHEIPAIPGAREKHLAESVLDWFGAALSVVVDARIPATNDAGMFNAVIVAGHLDDRTWQHVAEYFARDYSDDPFLAKATKFTGKAYAWRRSDLLTAREWYETQHFDETRIPASMDDFMHSQWPIESPLCQGGVAVHRPMRDPLFTARDRALLTLIAVEVSRFLPARPSGPLAIVGVLGPRLRQTLAGLLRGESEKQIAHRLELSRHTIHDYVKLLHRRFDVASRTELIAMFVSPELRNWIADVALPPAGGPTP